MAMALTAAPALAVKTHPYTGVSFGPDGTTATSFVNPQSIAIDQTSGNVYVYDAGDGKVYKFDSAGNPVNFSALSGNAIEGVGGAGNGENQIAVAPVGSAGGTAGDIYVSRYGAPVKIYAPSGTELGQLDVGENCGVATDPAGHVFVGSYPSTVREYVPTANPVTGADQSGTSSAPLPNICNVAADGIGNVYAANYAGNSIAKLEGIGDASATSIEPGASTLAIDPSNDILYANRGSEGAQYSSAGTLIGTFGAGGQLSGSRGIGVNGTTGNVYANGVGGKVVVFGPEAIVPGTITSAATAIRSTKATLNGTVNPDGVAVTECKFEYGTSTSYGSTEPCDGSIPTDSSDHSVTGDITGLSPDTTYHFRISATNANGTNYSSDKTFTTLSTAVTEDASAIGGNHATLNGIVSPGGEAVTECKFEYGKTSSYGGSLPCEGSIPTDDDPHPVTAALTHLLPNGTTYHFRLAVVRASGTSEGSNRSFDTATTVLTDPASGFTATGATLKGTLNPEGIEYTECKFEYGPTASYGSSALCAESPAAIGSGSSPVSVHADLSGLSTGAAYHYRLVATNPDGTVYGADTAFSTLGPLVGDEFAAQIGSEAAALHGQVNPQGGFTTYHFEYGDEGPCDSNICASVPIPDASAGGGTVDVPVSISLTGLQAGTTYYFRLVAVNPDGTTSGPGASFTTFPRAPDFDSCSNDEFRTGPSARLPDCRAYEQASPVDKNGNDVSGSADRFKASADGNAVTFFANGGIPGGVGAQDFPLFLAKRVGANWFTSGLIPSPAFGQRAQVSGWTDNLDDVLSSTVKFTNPGIQNGYVIRSSSTGSFEQITQDASSSDEIVRFILAGVSSDGSKVFFQVNGKLTPEAAEENTEGKAARNFYVWNRASNTISLVGVLPDSACQAAPPCVPAAGSFSGSFYWWQAGSLPASLERSAAEFSFDLQGEHVVSSDGSRAFFTAAGTGQIYMRKNATTPSASTTPVSASQRGTPDPNGTKPAIFMRATPSGSRVFFTSCEKLTDDSTAVSTSENSCGTTSQGQDLYAYDTASGGLSDLTVDLNPSDPNGADVRAVVGVSNDGDYVYFVANGDLDGSGSAKLGNCRAIPPNFYEYTGACNIYLWHDGEIIFIARLDTDNSSDMGGLSNWEPVLDFFSGGGNDHPKGRVSADGKTLLFQSADPLVPDAKGAQFYRYHYGDSELLCITCDPTGNSNGGGGLQSVAQPVQVGPDSLALTITRNLSSDGNRIFFETSAKLVPADVNGDSACPLTTALRPRPACQDVYEWEASGSGSCHSTAQNGGCLYLLSTGTGSRPSFFGDASKSGDDVFILTRDALVPQDGDGIMDVYDLRVDGGLASQHEVPLPKCTGDGCRGSASAGTTQQGAGTAVFSGPGDPSVKRQKSRKGHRKRHRKGRHHRHHRLHRQTARHGGAVR